MKTEEQRIHDDILAELLGRQAAALAIQTQLMVKLSALFDRPEEFIRKIMAPAEDNIRSAAKRAKAAGNPLEIRTAEAGVTFVEQYSAELIVAMTPKNRPQ